MGDGNASAGLSFQPLTPARWKDLEDLFGAKGACGGCWCMFWRLTRADFTKGKGEGNRRAFKKVITKSAPGILAYVDGQPAGWCAVAPRAEYPALQRSRVLASLDDQAVWSISCFFVARRFRRRGLALPLLQAAVDFVKRRGGTMVEGYPVDPASRTADAFVWTGLASTFKRAGFKECARRSPTRPIMRLTLSETRRRRAGPRP